MRLFLRICLLQTICFAAGLAAIAYASDDDERLSPLVQIAIRQGVPMPLKTSPFVLARIPQELEIYSPAFLLEEKIDGSIVVLRGFKRETLSKNGRGDALWRPFERKTVSSELGGFRVDFHRVSAFVCVVQLAARGDEATAQFLWKQVATTKRWSEQPNDLRTSEDVAYPRLFLGRCILDHLRFGFMQKGANWRNINRRIKALVRDIPELKWDVRDNVYGDLLETLYAELPKPQSTEELLLEWSRRPHDYPPPFLFLPDDPCYDARSDIPACKIVLRGFDAIPDLLVLADDTRLTAFRNFSPINTFRDNLRVGDLAKFLLGKITDQIDDEPDDEPPIRWRKWWEKARTRSEADVFAEATFRREDRKITCVNECPARILAHKYSSRLPSLFDEFIKDAAPDTQSYRLADALAASALSLETKVRVLVESAKKGSLENRRCLMSVLADLNVRKCTELVLSALRNLPRDSDRPYWTCPEASFSHVVMQLEDDEVWREFLRAAKRSSVGLRMEMMNLMTYSYIGEKNRGRRLAFLATFFDDAAVRQIPSHDPGLQGKYQGPCAAFTIPRIEVRDFAATQAACILGMDDSPDKSWTTAQWNGLRKRVWRKLASEKLPNLETVPTGK